MDLDLESLTEVDGGLDLMNGGAWKTATFALASTVLAGIISTAGFWVSIRHDLVTRDEIKAMIEANIVGAGSSYANEREIIRESLRNLTIEVRELRDQHQQATIEIERYNAKLEVLRAELRRGR